LIVSLTLPDALQQADKTAAVRQFVADFCKEGGKTKPELISKFISTLSYLLNDDSNVVTKRVLLALSGECLTQLNI